MLLEPTPPHDVCSYSDTAGEVAERRDLFSMRLRESVYPRGLTLSRHMHACAYLSLILQGSYTEVYQGSSAMCAEGSVRFLPPQEVHSNIYEEGARCLLVELQPDTLARLREHTRLLERPGEVNTPQAAMLARRLYAEFRQRDNAASIAMEGLVLEILAESVRGAAPAGLHAPKWLLRAREAIHARFLEVPSLTQLALAAGVHPVHLSREFRRYFGVTVGEYMRKLRLDHASQLLANTETPIAEIANVCGFADQSHLTSTFKRTVGMTPARFRELHG